MKVLSLIALIFFLLGANASAHRTGQSLEKVVGNYLVDVGYNALGTIRAGEAIHFDFTLFDALQKTPVAFTDVWTKISKDNVVVFAAGLQKKDILPAGMIYSFSESGNYELGLRFQNNDATLTETSFTITVESKDSPMTAESTWFLAALAGFALGLGIALFLKKRTR